MPYVLLNFSKSLVIMDQQLSSIQLHVLETEARQLERAQSTICDELSGVDSDEPDKSIELCLASLSAGWLSDPSTASNLSQLQNDLEDKTICPLILQRNQSPLHRQGRVKDDPVHRDTRFQQ